MATFLDITTLQSFSVIFVFLFVLLVVYAMMMYSKVLGGNQIVMWLVAFVIAIFVVMSELATLVIQKIAPVFAVILVFLVIIMVVGHSMFGGAWAPESLQGMKWMVFAVLIIALVVGTLMVVRDNISVPETGEDYEETSTVFFHPNFLGLILFFLIAVFTVGLLTVRSM